MLESLWILAAVEINGALVSHAANVQASPTRCAVEYSAVRSAVKTSRPPADGIWRTNPSHCQWVAEDTLLRIRLPQKQLASPALTLGETADIARVHLLHAPDALAAKPAYAGQPDIRNIPSAALDVFGGAHLRGAGAVLARGPFSMQALQQTARPGRDYRRATAEYLSESGGWARAGDFRTDRGPTQTLAEYRGILLTNRATPLRGDGRVEALMQVTHPSRVQFFDQTGRQIYSSDMLSPGNYQIQGIGASTTPGFLEARLIDIHGVVQSISLPWSADRRLLNTHQIEWEAFAGRPRQLGAGLSPQHAWSGRVRAGLSTHTTVGLHGWRHERDREWAMEANSRWIPGMTNTIAASQRCDMGEGCRTGWFAEARAALAGRTHLTTSFSQNTGNGPMPSSSLLIAAQTALHQRISISLGLADRRDASGSHQRSHSLSAQIRLRNNLNLHLAARHHRSDAGQPASWQGIANLVMHFDEGRSFLSTLFGWSSPSATSSRSQHILQAQTGSGGLYGSHLGLSHALDGSGRSEASLRHASAIGEVSLRANDPHRRPAWAAASRLWITEHGAHLGPVGDDNLVIQNVGLSQVRIGQSGRDSQTTNQQGTAVFRKASAWTDASYAIDPGTLPMGFTMSGGVTRIPLASNRAYLVDHRARWAQQLLWRISPWLPDTGHPMEGVDRHGQKVFIDADGYVDLQSSEQLPVDVQDRRGRLLRCLPQPSARIRTTAGIPETILQCLPGLAHQAGVPNTGVLQTGAYR